MPRLGITFLFPHALGSAMLFATPSFATTYGFMPLDPAPGGSSSSLAGGANATLDDAAANLVDSTRGSVLRGKFNSRTLVRA